MERRRRDKLIEELMRSASEELHHASEVLDRVSWCIASRSRASNEGKKTSRSELHPASPGCG